MKHLERDVRERYGFHPNDLENTVDWDIRDGILIVDSRHSDYSAFPNFVERDPPGTHRPGCWRHYFNPKDAPDDFYKAPQNERGKARRSFSASADQRAMVAGRGCLIPMCGKHPVDAAHIIPRGLGGCDDRLCVMPLCRDHHRQYDTGNLDVLGHLWPAYPEELKHALGHVGPMRLVKHLTGERSANSEPARAA